MTIPKDCKRLAEVDFPIAVVSKHSAREKSIRHGHPSTLHLWWARRPLPACRAVVYGALDPASRFILKTAQATRSQPLKGLKHPCLRATRYGEQACHHLPDHQLLETRHAKPSPLARQRIDELLRSMGDKGADLMDLYFKNNPEA